MADSEDVEVGVESRVSLSILGLMRWANRPDVIRELWAAESRELSPAEISLLISIADLGPVRTTNLAAAHGVDRSTISPQVRRLESAGFVERAQDPSDGRASLLALSEVGQETTSGFRQAASRVLNVRLAHWPQKDRRELAEILESLVASLNPDGSGSLASSG